METDGRGYVRRVALAVRDAVVNLWLLTAGRRAVNRWMDEVTVDVLTRPRPSAEVRAMLERARFVAAAECAGELSPEHVRRAFEDLEPDLRGPVPGTIQYAPALRSVLEAAAQSARAEARQEISLGDLERALGFPRP